MTALQGDLFQPYKTGDTMQKKVNDKYKYTKDNVKVAVVDNDDYIKIRSNKQRINITLDPFLWGELGNITDNKSKFVNDMLKKLIEEELQKKIIFVSED